MDLREQVLQTNQGFHSQPGQAWGSPSRAPPLLNTQDQEESGGKQPAGDTGLGGGQVPQAQLKWTVGDKSVPFKQEGSTPGLPPSGSQKLVVPPPLLPCQSVLFLPPPLWAGTTLNPAALLGARD